MISHWPVWINYLRILPSLKIRLAVWIPPRIHSFSSRSFFICLRFRCSHTLFLMEFPEIRGEGERVAREWGKGRREDLDAVLATSKRAKTRNPTASNHFIHFVSQDLGIASNRAMKERSLNVITLFSHLLATWELPSSGTFLAVLHPPSLSFHLFFFSFTSVSKHCSSF